MLLLSGMTPLVIELRRGRCEVRSTIGIGESKPPADRILHPCATDVPSREISGSDGANIGMHARLDKFKNRTACDLRSTNGFEVPLGGECSLVPVLACNVHKWAPHEPLRECLDQCGRSLQNDLSTTEGDVIIKKTCPYAVQHGNVRMHN